MNCRKANMADKECIAKVHVDSWRTTYKGIMPDAFLANLSYEQFTAIWEKNLNIEDNFVIAVENEEGKIVGFADSWKRASNTEENAIDLTSIYLLETYQGKGLGKLLLKDLFTHYKNQGYTKVFVEVLEDNKTRYFYEYYGAEFVKTVQIKIGGKIVNESIYAWRSVDRTYEKLISTKE